MARFIVSGCTLFRSLGSFLTAALFALTPLAVSHAQILGPTSGDVTVALIQELDSKVNPAGTAQALVTKSTNSAFSKANAAVVQIAADTESGGFSARLIQVGTKTQTLQVYSSTAVLAPNLMNREDMLTIHRGQAAAGQRVYLAVGMNVKFTLTTPPTPPPPPKALAEVSAWQPTAMQPDYSDSPLGEGVSILGTATNGAKQGRVRLLSGCYKGSGIATWLIVSQPLVGVSLEAFGEDIENNAKVAVLKIGDDSGTSSRVSSADHYQKNTAFELALDVPDQFYTTAYSGKPLKISIVLPNPARSDLIANFTIPADAEPMLKVAQPCIENMKRAAAEAERQAAIAKAKVVASCPDKSQKTLVSMKVKLLPVNKYLEADPTDGTEAEWDLKTLKRGQHAVLDCTYQPISKADKSAAIGNYVTVPIPASAVSCTASTDGDSPVSGNCSKN